MGWAAIPPECPQHFFNKILERRSALLAVRNTSARPRPAALTIAELRAKVAEVGAQIAADRIAETGIAIQYTDERGNIAFRGPSDEEWTLSQKKRALELATIVHDELVEEDRRDPRGSYVWNWREGAYVKRGDKC